MNPSRSTVSPMMNGRVKARRSGADDYQVADLCLVNRLVEAKTIGELLIGRVAKRDLAVTNRDRHVGRGDVEIIQQFLHVGVAVKVDVRIWVSVAGQELFDAKCPCAIARPDDRNISKSMSDQLHSAEDEGSHKDIAQLAVGLHERQ